MKTRIILLASLFWCLLMQTMAAPKPEKKLYVPMDYSTCGYRASEKAIPNVPNAVFVKAVDGDCTDRLQRAIDYVAKGEVRLKINDILGAFMFGGEESDKKVKVLSGGERSRLAMIRLLLEPVNLLILDEPTNHLDMPSKDVLKEAIKAFDGTAIIVSHDREFLDGLVTKVYEFGGGKVREHLGGIYDFLRTKKINDLNQLGSQPQMMAAPKAVTKAAATTTSSASPSVTPEGEAVLQKTLSYAEHKELQKRKNRLEKAVKQYEAKIEQLEQRLKELDELLMQPENASDMTMVTEYTDIKRDLDEEVERWEKASEELESLTQ